jgi:hypothetical protein
LTAVGALSGFDGTLSNHVGGGFHNINGLVSFGEFDRLTGLDAGAVWDLGVTDPDSGATVNRYTSTNVLTFVGLFLLNGGDLEDRFNIGAGIGQLAGIVFFQLSGGGDDDTFAFAEGAGVIGAIDGGTGTDTIDLSADPTPRSVTLRGASDGFLGSDPVFNTYSSIEALVGGSSATDSLIAVPSGGFWSLGAIHTYHLGSDLGFLGFEQLTGGDGDTFAISGEQTVSLSADGGTFVFAAGARVWGTIDGGSGESGLPSTLDWSAFAWPVAVALAATGVDHGFDGVAVRALLVNPSDEHESVILAGGFTNIDAVVGPAPAPVAWGVLVGLDAVASWDLPAAATDPGVYTVASRPALPLHFLHFDHLFGGAETDTFHVAAPSRPTTINAGAGDDVIAVGSLPAQGDPTGMLGVLTVDGGVGADTLSIDDSADTEGNASLDGIGDTLTATTLGLEDGHGRPRLSLEYHAVEALGVQLGSGARRFAVENTNPTTATTLNGGSGQSFIEVQGTGGPLVINGGESGDEVVILATGGSTTVNAGGGTDAIYIVGTGGPTTVHTDEGDDEITIGTRPIGLGHLDGRLDAIAGDLAISGDGGTDTLIVDDSGDGSGRTLTLGPTRLTGLNGGPSALSYDTIETLTVSLGTGHDTLTVTDTSAGTATAIDTSNGSDTIMVQAVSSATIINSGPQIDTVTVGSAGPALAGVVRGIAAALTLVGGTAGVDGSDVLIIDSSGAGLATGGALRRRQVGSPGTATTLTGLGMAPEGITYDDFEQVDVHLGAAADTFRVELTTSSAATTINGGGGADRFNVQATSGPTTINGGAGDDVFAVGSLAPASGGTVDAIAGPLLINGDAGTDTVTVDDRGDVTPNTGSLTSTALTGLGMGVGGLTYDAVEALTVNLGAGDDTFTVVTTAPGTTTTLNGGPGNDTFTGNLAGVIVNQLLAARAAAAGAPPVATATSVTALNNLFINGEGGIDTLVLDDRSGEAVGRPHPADARARGSRLGRGPREGGVRRAGPPSSRGPVPLRGCRAARAPVRD